MTYFLNIINTVYLAFAASISVKYVDTGRRPVADPVYSVDTSRWSVVDPEFYTRRWWVYVCLRSATVRTPRENPMPISQYRNWIDIRRSRGVTDTPPQKNRQPLGNFWIRSWWRWNELTYKSIKLYAKYSLIGIIRKTTVTYAEGCRV